MPSEKTRDSSRLDVVGGTPPSPRGPMMPPGAGVVTNWGRGDYSPADIVEDRTFDRRQHSSSAAVDAAYSSPRSHTSAMASAEAAASRQHSPGAADFFRAAELRQGELRAPASRRDPHEPTTTTNSNSVVANTGNNRASRSSAAARPPSTETALAPRASFGNHRRTLQAAAGETNESSRASRDHRRSAGWRRILSGRRGEGGGNAAGDDAAEEGCEVWEWNGRRVVIHVSPPKQPPSALRPECGAKTTGGGEEGEQSRRCGSR